MYVKAIKKLHSDISTLQTSQKSSRKTFKGLRKRQQLKMQPNRQSAKK
jgi:hypothetical protein